MSKNFKEVKKDYWKLRKNLFLNKFKSSKQESQHVVPPITAPMSEKIAFIIDGEIVDIINCQPRLAAILLSEPLILDIGSEDKNISSGWKYVDDKFVPPIVESNIDEKN